MNKPVQTISPWDLAAQQAQAVARALVHIAPIGACQQATARFRQLVDVLQALVTREELDAALVGTHAAGNAVEQGRLARAGFTRNGQDLPGMQLEPDAGACRAAAKMLVDAGDPQQRIRA